MTSSNTLFSHLALRFSAHPENLATEALLYLLDNAKNANSLFARYVASTETNFNPVAQFNSQVSSEGNSIPDLVGTDESGKNIFIIENKFWAELTPNQPLEYLPLLHEDVSGALFFVCPEKRISVLHAELVRLLEESDKYGDSENIQESGDVVVDRITDSQYMVIISWRRLLSDLESLLDPIEERSLITDLAQLQGLCDQMDYEGFIPLRSGETGNLEIPRRVIDYRELVDGIVQQLLDTSEVSTRGLRSTTSTYSSGRYIHLRREGEFGAICALDFTLWRRYGRSPIWLRFSYSDWGRGAEVADLLSKTNLYLQDIRGSYREIVTPILLTHNSDRQRVIQDGVDQIRYISQRLLDDN